MAIRKSHSLLLFKLLLTSTLLVTLFMYVDLTDVWHRIRAINPLWLLAAFALVAAGYVFCGLRWAWIAEGLGMAVSRRRKIRLYFLGMFASLFLPSTIGGDVVRAVLLARGEGRKGLALPASASVIIDRVNGLYALVLLLSLCMLLFSWPWLWWLSWAGLLAAMWGGLWLLPWLLRRLPARLEKLGRLPLTEPAFRQRWWRSMPVSLLFQLMIIQAHVCLGMAVGLQMGWPAFAMMVGLVSLVTVLPISLNGFGVREFGYVGLATYFGGSAEAAAAMAALWVIVLAVSALPGLYVMWRLGGVRHVGRQVESRTAAQE